MSAVTDEMGPWVKQQLADMGQSDAPDMLVSLCACAPPRRAHRPVEP